MSAASDSLQSHGAELVVKPSDHYDELLSLDVKCHVRHHAYVIPLEYLISAWQSTPIDGSDFVLAFQLALQDLPYPL